MNSVHDTQGPRLRANTFTLLEERPVSPGGDPTTNRLEEIGAQAARIAHDLNNLLSPIVMSLESFRPCLEEPAHLAMLEIARKSTVRASDLVRQILSFARGVEEVRSPIDSRAVVHEIAASVRATFPAALQIQADVAEHLAPIVANATQLHRALLNLCINARDAMPDGGTLTLRAANVVFDHANIRLPRNVRDGRYVLFEVSDTGGGIPAAIREKIFDPFFTTKGAGKGTGLGLASVRSIVESHAGLLSLQTEIGKGTTFRILIPVSDSAVAANASASELRIVAA